jgi:hypothetical protein
MKKILYAIAATIALTFTTSCTHKDLCYDHLHTVNVQVRFDWQFAPEADPASMAVYLFPKNGDEVLRYDFTDRSGGTIRIPFGDYDAFCINSDTENIRHNGTEQISTLEITTPTTTLLTNMSSIGVRTDNAPRADGTEEERIALSPDKIWNDYVEGIEILMIAEDQTITLYPAPGHNTYTVEVRNASNLKYVRGISGSLSSLAGGLMGGMDQTTQERVTIPFDATISDDDTTVTGGLLTFGHFSSEEIPHQLTIYAVLTDGSKWYYNYDVTDQIHSAPDQRNIHIIVDGLPLPKPIVNGGGFQPEVDEWQSERIDLVM